MTSLVVVVVFQAVIVAVVGNSVVQFVRVGGAVSRRVLAIVSSLVMALLLSIYYARAVGETFRRIDAEWLTSSEASANAAGGSWALSWGHWLDEAYFGWWIDHLPTIVRRPQADFKQGAAMLVVIAAAYVVRSAVWFFFRRRGRYPALNGLVSSYLVHLTLWGVVAVFLWRVYAFGPAGLTVFLVGTLVCVVIGVTSVVGDAIAGIVSVLRIGGSLLALGWKWIAVAGTMLARLVQRLRRTVWHVYDRFIRQPLVRAHDAVTGAVDRAAGAADRIIEREDAIESGRAPTVPPTVEPAPGSEPYLE